MSKEQVFVIGTGLSGLSAAIQLADAHPERNVLVFEGPGAGQWGAAPIILHMKGRRALSAAGVELPCNRPNLDSILVNGEHKLVSEVYSNDSALVCQQDLMDGLKRRASILDNMTVKEGVSVAALDLSRETMAVEETNPMFNNACSTYDLPQLLVLAEGCSKLLEQMEAQVAHPQRRPAPKAPAAPLSCMTVSVAAEEAAADAIQVFSKGLLMVALFPALGTLCLVAPAAELEAAQQDSSALKASLSATAVPATAVEAICSQVAASALSTYSPGRTCRPAFVTAKGSNIVMVGPALFTSAAPLVLDADAALQSAQRAAQLAHSGGSFDVRKYCRGMNIFAGDLLHASCSQGEDALGSIGLGGGRIPNKCKGQMRPQHMLKSVVETPLVFGRNLIGRLANGRK